MTTTHTTSGGGFYETAVELRSMARTARESYPDALARMREAAAGDDDGQFAEAIVHAPMLVLQTVGFELAAALYCVAQSIEDANHGAQPRQAP